MFGIGPTSQKIFFFKTEGDEVNRPLAGARSHLMRDFEQDCQGARIVICTRGVGYSVVVGGQNEWGDVLLASRYSNDIGIGTTECMEWMAGDIKAEAAELLGEINFCTLQPVR